MFIDQQRAIQLCIQAGESIMRLLREPLTSENDEFARNAGQYINYAKDALETMMPQHHYPTQEDVAQPERIVAAAVIVNGHPPVIGYCHYDAIEKAESMGYGKGYSDSIEYGFLTSTGRFVDRDEAYMIAHSQRQVKSDRGGVIPPYERQDLDSHDLVPAMARESQGSNQESKSYILPDGSAFFTATIDTNRPKKVKKSKARKHVESRDDIWKLPMPPAAKRFARMHGLKAIDRLPKAALKLASQMTNPGLSRKGFKNRDVSSGYDDHSAIKDSMHKLQDARDKWRYYHPDGSEIPAKDAATYANASRVRVQRPQSWALLSADGRVVHRVYATGREQAMQKLEALYGVTRLR
jgi:hypothetical protein